MSISHPYIYNNTTLQYDRQPSLFNAPGESVRAITRNGENYKFEKTDEVLLSVLERINALFHCTKLLFQPRTQENQAWRNEYWRQFRFGVLTRTLYRPEFKVVGREESGGVPGNTGPHRNPEDDPTRVTHTTVNVPPSDRVAIEYTGEAARYIRGVMAMMEKVNANVAVSWDRIVKLNATNEAVTKAYNRCILLSHNVADGVRDGAPCDHARASQFGSDYNEYIKTGNVVVEYANEVWNAELRRREAATAAACCS